MADRETARAMQNVNAQRVAVRSTAWLGLLAFMNILDYPIAELGRIIKIRVELFRLATAFCCDSEFAANLFRRRCNVCFWDLDVHRLRVRVGMRVLRTHVNRRRGLHSCHGGVGASCDFEDSDIQLEGRVAGETL